MRKGGMPFTVVILVLIILSIIISLGIIYILFLCPDCFQEKTTDAFCSISTSGKNFAVAFPELCTTRPKTITPNNWEECPYYKDMKEEKEKTDGNFKDWRKDIKEDYWNNCTAEQFAKLSVKCWQLMGEGEAKRGYFECYTACVSSDKALEDARNKLTRAENKSAEAKRIYDIAVDRYKDYDDETKELVLEDYTEELNKTQAATDKAQKALDELGGLPKVAISIKDIIRVMKTAKMEDEERTYSEVLRPGKDEEDCCLSQAGFWDEVLRESSFRKALWRNDKGLEGKILDGDVISIYFSDKICGPLSFLCFGDRRIVLRFKTLCS